MKNFDSTKGLLPLSVLQIGCGSFGVHLKEHLETKVATVKVISGRADKIPDLFEFDLIFLATNDSSLESLIVKIKEQNLKAKVIHFSGFHYFENARGLHPVASFNKESSYKLNDITFVADGPVDENLNLLFPKKASIAPSKKKEYHSFLSVSANALQLLMHNIGRDFENQLEMDSSLLKQIVIQSLQEESRKGSVSFSGPWVRGEKEFQDRTVESMNSESLKNLNSLFIKEINFFKKHSKGGK